MYFTANQPKFTVCFGLIERSISHILFRSHNYKYTALLIIADYLRNRSSYHWHPVFQVLNRVFARQKKNVYRYFFFFGKQKKVVGYISFHNIE